MNNSSEKDGQHYAAPKHKDKDAERTEDDKSEAQIQVIWYSKYQRQLQPPCNKTCGRHRSVTASGRQAELQTAIKEAKEGKLHPPGPPLAVKQACCQSQPLLRSTHKALGLLKRKPAHTHTHTAIKKRLRLDSFLTTFSHSNVSVCSLQSCAGYK